MEQKDTTSSPNFSLYESITYGPLRPHLPENNDLPAVEKRYKQLVYRYLPELDPTREIRIGIETPPFVRYNDVALKEGDRLEITPIDGNTLDVKQVGRIIVSNLYDIPSPFNTICAYYLFLIEEEHECIKQQFKRMLHEDFINIKHNILVCRQRLTWQKQQAIEYQQAIFQIGFTNLTEHAPFYVLYVLLFYVQLQLEKLHDIFTPIVNSSLSPAEIAFNTLEVHAPKAHVVNALAQPYTQKPTGTNSIQRTWHQLFKNQKAADDILKLLKEEGMVGTDNSWLQTPTLNTMIALYNVLLQKGYISNPYEKASILAAAFNHQFHTDFKSKKWQPQERDSGIKYEERFKIIPAYKA